MNYGLLILLVSLITIVVPRAILGQDCDLTDEECEMICRMNITKPLPDNYEEDLFQCYQQTKDIKCLEK